MDIKKHKKWVERKKLMQMYIVILVSKKIKKPREIKYNINFIQGKENGYVQV